MAGAKCDACAATPPKNFCDQCGGPNAQVVRVNSKPLWRSYQNGRCLLCSEEKVLDVNEICFTCNNEHYEMKIRDAVLCGSCANHYDLICKKCKETTDVYAEGTSYCPSCFYGDDFVPQSEAMGRHWETAVCYGCGEMSHLNAEDLCKNCYVERAVSEANNEDWGKTKVCPECRKITKRGRKTCKSCALKKQNFAVCMGCTSKFVKNGDSSFCNTCEDLKEKGRCTSCAVTTSQVDEHGWCEKCEKNNTP